MKTLSLFMMLLTLNTQAATHYFVRHAEKVTSNQSDKNPPLSLKGQQRAQNLALLLSQANIKHIYSTAYQRTEQTAQPLAKQLNTTVRHYDPSNMTAFLDKLKKSADNTLVVGHSNTTTEAVNHISEKTLKGLSEKDYGDVYQVVISEGTVTINHLKLPPAKQ